MYFEIISYGGRMNKKSINLTHVLFIILVICIAILAIAGYIHRLTSPVDAREEIYELGLQALNLMDRYLDGHLSNSRLAGGMIYISNKINEFENRTSREILIGTVIFRTSLSSSINIDVLENRNNLARYLNQPIRQN